jgi:uncharacterized membrane protein
MCYFVRTAVYVALCLGFLVAAQVVSMFLNIYLGADEYLVWFFFGVLLAETARKIKSCL